MELRVGLAEDAVEQRMDFDPFFHAHFEKVARAAALVTRDAGTGQDLAQEAFLRLLERWEEMDSDDHARNFAYKVAINLARSHLRKHGRVFLYGLRSPDDPGGASPMESADAWFEVVGALEALRPRQRQRCVVLVDYADMDSTRAADILGMSAGTVRQHLMRGRRALRNGLGLAPKEDLA